MTARTGTTARAVVAEILRPLLPPRWQLVEHEGQAQSDRPRVRITVREIASSDTGAAAQHRLTVRATVTVPTDSLEQAEAALDDAMDDFLFAVDRTELVWDTATKGRFEDEAGRLGYALDFTDIRTTPTNQE